MTQKLPIVVCDLMASISGVTYFLKLGYIPTDRKNVTHDKSGLCVP